MDWENVQDAIKRWLAAVSGMAEAQIDWAGEPVAHRAYPFVSLQLIHQQGERGTDELRYEEGTNGALTPTIVGNRQVTLLVTVISRNHYGVNKAYSVLDRLRTQVFLPSALEMFESMELSVRDVGATQNLPSSSENRDLSAASLSIELAYTVSETDFTLVEPIEKVQLGGDVESIGTIPDHDVP